jgi:hypothetical protein
MNPLILKMADFGTFFALQREIKGTKTRLLERRGPWRTSKCAEGSTFYLGGEGEFHG